MKAFSIAGWIRLRETRLGQVIRWRRRRDPRQYFEAVQAIYHPFD